MSITPQELSNIPTDLLQFLPCVVNNSDFGIDIHAIKRSPELIKDIDHPSLQQQLAAIEFEPRCIRFIKNPDIAVVELALTTDFSGLALQFAPKPLSDRHIIMACTCNARSIIGLSLTEHQQKIAIQVNPICIKYIENPSELIILDSVRKNPFVLEYLTGPFSVEVMLTAVSRNGDSIRHIKNPPDNVCLTAVKNCGVSIRYILDPSDEMKECAIRQNPSALHHIHNITTNMWLLGIESNPYTTLRAMKNCEVVDDNLFKQALTIHGTAIEFVSNPSEELQMIAVTQNGYAIRYIKNPSEAVQLAAVAYFQKK